METLSGQTSMEISPKGYANPIFIVGVSRSGTSLMRRILNKSSMVAISKENHFMGHIISSEGMRYKMSRYGDLGDNENVSSFVEHLYSGEIEKVSKHRKLSAQWQWMIEKVTKEEFEQRILESDRSDQALFTIMMQIYADHRGKPIMGEKTPAHVRYISTLLEWFPNATIVHMLRDPRAIFVSEVRRRRREAVTTPYKQLVRIPIIFELFILIQVTLIWFESVWRYHQYKQRYSENYYLMRFEDLVKDPEKQVIRLCDFIGIDFQEKMLEQAVVSKGFQVGTSGFDAHAAERWRSQISPWANAWFALLFRSYLKEFGYTG